MPKGSPDRKTRQMGSKSWKEAAREWLRTQYCKSGEAQKGYRGRTRDLREHLLGLGHDPAQLLDAKRLKDWIGYELNLLAQSNAIEAATTTSTVLLRKRGRPRKDPSPSNGAATSGLHAARTATEAALKRRCEEMHQTIQSLQQTVQSFKKVSEEMKAKNETLARKNAALTEALSRYRGAVQKAHEAIGPLCRNP